MSIKESKIPRTRRSSRISKDDLQEKQERCLTPDLHMHDGPLNSEDLRVAPKHEDDYELECFTDGHATAEHGSSETEVPDKTDVSPETDTYSNYEVVWTVISILSYIFDVGSDIYLAFVYYNDGDTWWFTLTVIFIVVPSLTITLFSFVWYIQDRKNQSYPFIWLPRLVLLFLQLAPLLRCIVF